MFRLSYYIFYIWPAFCVAIHNIFDYSLCQNVIMNITRRDSFCDPGKREISRDYFQTLCFAGISTLGTDYFLQKKQEDNL